MPMSKRGDGNYCAAFAERNGISDVKSLVVCLLNGTHIVKQISRREAR